MATVPDRIQVVGTGLFQLGVDAGHQADQLVAADHLVHQLDRARLPDRQRDGRLGIDDHPPQRQDRQHIGILGAIRSLGGIWSRSHFFRH